MAVGGTDNSIINGRSWYLYDNTNSVARFFVDTSGRVGVGLGSSVATAFVDINSDILRLRTAKTPATSTSSGNQGDHCWDADYIYICTANSNWKRATLSTF